MTRADLPPRSLPPRPQPRPGSRLPVYTIAAICIVIELALLAADFNLVGTPRLRGTVYEYAGFWPGLLGDWHPNYPGQWLLMFVTYGFLHGGIAHLAVNMYTLMQLGRLVQARVGTWGFLAVYMLSMLGGGLGFGLLADTLNPMVGASGALFGLAGALVAWNYIDRYTYKLGLWPIAQIVALLVAINVVLYWAMNGQLAWETHLGGFVSGWIAAVLLDPRGQIV